MEIKRKNNKYRLLFLLLAFGGLVILLMSVLQEYYVTIASKPTFQTKAVALIIKPKVKFDSLLYQLGASSKYGEVENVRVVYHTRKIQPQKNEEPSKFEDPFKDLKISDFKDWKTFTDEDLGISIKYPPEFYIQKHGEQLVFDFFAENSPFQKHEGSVLATLRITREEGSMEEILGKREFKDFMMLEREQSKLEGEKIEKIRYRDAFAGGMMYEMYVPDKAKTLNIWYAGDNPLEPTFEKMVTTFKKL